LLRLGREGYKKVQQGCYDVGKFFAQGIEKMGIFEMVYDCDSKKGIPAVTWKLKHADNCNRFKRKSSF
jgi:glutamate decarboxylase